MPAQYSRDAQILHERIDRAIELIPEKFPRREDLVRALRGRQESIAFTAPGAMDGRISEVADILSEYLPDPDRTNWAFFISQIFSAGYE